MGDAQRQGLNGRKGGRGPGRPYATETRDRVQYSLKSAISRELREVHATGAMGRTFSGTLQMIFEQWLEANRPLIPYLREADSYHRTLIRTGGRAIVTKALRERTVQRMYEHSGGLMNLEAAVAIAADVATPGAVLKKTGNE